MIFVPTVVAAGRPFDVKMAVSDENGFPCFKCDEDVILDRTPFESFPEKVQFDRNKVAILTVKDVLCNHKGIFRLSASFCGKTYFSNPFSCTEKVNSKIYWGDPHVHTVLSDCHPDRCR